MDFSNYIIYVDESGDHNLSQPNAKYPVFVLSFCIFDKSQYNQHVVRQVQELKFRYFGHDMIVLHEREILKRTGQFKNFDKDTQQRFLQDISRLMTDSKFNIIACVVDKDKLPKDTDNPYHLALQAGLQALYDFLAPRHALAQKTFVVFEQRGLKEDNELRVAFTDICQGKNIHKTHYPFELILASKYTNSAGLQFADLTARPIGNHSLKPTQPNQAFEIINKKLINPIISLP